MTLITWTEATYGTAVPVCDNEHKTLFDMLNALHECAAGDDRAAVGQKLDELINFVLKHFATEERLMQQKGYPGYVAHKAEHDKLVETCAGLQKQFHAGEAEVTQDTTAFVKGWLDTHIPGFDKPYGPTLAP